MKVLALLDSLTPGGTEQSTVQLAGELRALGVTTIVASLKRTEPSLHDQAQASGLTVVDVKPGGVVRQARAVRTLIKRHQPDLLHTALFRADQVGRLAAKGTATNVLSSLVSTPYDAARFHDPRITPWKLRASQVIDAVTARLGADAFHAVSAGVKEANARSLRLPRSRIVVAERGRDVGRLGQPSLQRRAEARAALGVADDATMLLSLGRLEFQKAHDTLVDSLWVVNRRVPGVVTLIAGKDGSLGEDVRRRVAAANAAGIDVRLLGHRSDVGDLLCACDALVISSRFEGTAGVALEAMALGVPIVSTRLDGLVGVLEDGVNAVLCKPDSPAALGAAIVAVLIDRELSGRLGQAGRIDFEQRFTLSAAAQRMKALYEAVAGP